MLSEISAAAAAQDPEALAQHSKTMMVNAADTTHLETELEVEKEKERGILASASAWPEGELRAEQSHSNALAMPQQRILTTVALFQQRSSTMGPGSNPSKATSGRRVCCSPASALVWWLQSV